MSDSSQTPSQTFKDLFSQHAADYQRFRPRYPAELFEYLSALSPAHELVWDCATGNGQAASMLAAHFDAVYASDASAEQIAHAIVTPAVDYHVATAEHSGLPAQAVDLITVFQAFHWFDEAAFFAEAKRVAKPGAPLAVVGYHTVQTGLAAVDAVYQDFCFDYLWEKNCWDMDRRSLNQAYAETRFPFAPITTPSFAATMQWTYDDYVAYLNTWSAVKTYIRLYNDNPVSSYVEARIRDHWPNPNQARSVTIPLILKVGYLHDSHYNF